MTRAEEIILSLLLHATILDIAQMTSCRQKYHREFSNHKAMLTLV